MSDLLRCCLLSLLIVIVGPLPVYSKGSGEGPVTPQTSVDQEQLLAFLAGIAERRAAITNLDRQLATTQVEPEVARLRKERQRQSEKLAEQMRSFEEIATGEVDLSLFDKPIQQQEFSWQSELKEVFQPILLELKRATERPRQIERLRTKKEELQRRLAAANLALDEISSLMNLVQEPAIRKPLADLMASWQVRHQDLQGSLQLVELQLSEKTYSDKTDGWQVLNAIKAFLAGRGLHLLLAMVAFVLTYAILRYVGGLVERWVSRDQDKESRFYGRLLHIIFQAFTLVVALLALMGTLYAVGDWMILTLVIILLVGVVFALRHSLPRYMDEVRLLLNIGSVREGERVIYAGLPWKVSRLNIASTLVNPLLSGGILRLPLREMTQLISRKWSPEEPWFPCKPGDFLLLQEDILACVMLQTPELVQLKVRGGAVKSFTVADFLASKPQNLSVQGFEIFVSFGLDYGLQQKITDEVLVQMEAHLRTVFMASSFAPYLKELRVDFDYAGESSLNIVIAAVFPGDAAGEYINIRRFLQSAAVDACNQHGWTIPFNQLTVHMEPET